MISWIIAAYNEEKRLSKTLSRLVNELKDIDFEIVVSDDGSEDGTIDVVSMYSNVLSNVKIVTNAHMGRGSALRNGLNNSKGDIAVFSSADICMSHNQVEELLKLLNDFDLILLSKHTHGSLGLDVGIARRFLSLSFSFLVRLLWRLPYGDTQGVKIGKTATMREIIPHAKSKGFLFDLEVVVHAHKMNRKVVEVPWTYSYSEGSKVNFKAVLQMTFGLLLLKIKHLV
ncbi:MAG: glycosyltransferase [Candidatus Bathyarchaeota archaeon]|nr:glycosyltransferase [Candidatus Bathyarchaeota archaeon]